MRELWVLDGVIEHGFRYEVLRQVNNNFEKIDAVPQGYLYPEIYSNQTKPQFLINHLIKKRGRKNAQL